MSIHAQDLMQHAVKIVAPDTPLIGLDRAFLEARVNAFPVVDAGRLVGIVSRSDIVRQISIEQSLAEMCVDAGRETRAFSSDAGAELSAIGTAVGRRLERLRVRDCMISGVISAAPGTPAQTLAELFVRHDVHHLLIVEGQRLLGIVSALDLVRLIAEGGAPSG
jgi:CBS domain-containing protein